MPKTKIDRYPLFSVSVKIEKEIEGGVGKYSVYFVDPEVQVNAGIILPTIRRIGPIRNRREVDITNYRTRYFY